MESSTTAIEQAILGAFKMFDRDGDGKISWAEFRAVMGSLIVDLTDATAEKMMKEADKDGDNTLSFEEFKTLLLPPDNKPLVCGRFIGEKLPGQTRILRNAILNDGEELVSSFRGKTNMKVIFEENVKSCPDKPLLGSR